MTEQQHQPMPVTITCPTCGQAFPVPTEVLGVDGHQVTCRMDRSDLYGHLAECAGEAGQRAGEAEAERRARDEHPAGKALERPTAPPAQFIMPPYVAKGQRRCVMCTTPAGDCLQRIHDTSVPCCGACGEGNTHPAPQESTPCATWAAERAQH